MARYVGGDRVHRSDQRVREIAHRRSGRGWYGERQRRDDAEADHLERGGNWPVLGLLWLGLVAGFGWRRMRSGSAR